MWEGALGDDKDTAHGPWVTWRVMRRDALAQTVLSQPSCGLGQAKVAAAERCCSACCIVHKAGTGSTSDVQGCQEGCSGQRGSFMVSCHEMWQPEIATAGKQHVLGDAALQLGCDPLAHAPCLSDVLEHAPAHLHSSSESGSSSTAFPTVMSTLISEKEDVHACVHCLGDAALPLGCYPVAHPPCLCNILQHAPAHLHGGQGQDNSCKALGDLCASSKQMSRLKQVLRVYQWLCFGF